VLEEDRNRIEEEEMIRETARRILDEERRRRQKEQAAKEPFRKKALAFLQTTLGTGLLIWFLSSVVVASVSYGFTRWQADQAAKRESAETISKINIEMAARIRPLRALVDAELAKIDRDWNKIIPARINTYITSSPQNEKERDPITNIYPEYSDLSMLALINNLQALATGSQRAAADKALQAVTDISNRADQLDERYEVATKEEHKQLLQQVHATLNGSSLPKEWR
jgi:hypothetical protein